MTKFYLKQPIEAEQFDGSFDMQAKYAMMSVHFTSGKSATSMPVQNGDVKVNVGDWIATGAKGEHWLIADDAFQQAYAELPMIPHNVWIYIQLAQLHDIPISSAFMLAETLDKDAFHWIINNSNEFARAWLDGYQVEGE